jgi:hypothetical protein
MGDECRQVRYLMRGVAAAVAGAALVTAMGASPVMARAVPGWRGTYLARSAQANLLLGVAAPSRNDAWAVGEYEQQTGPIILHWDGKRWLSADVPGAGPAFEPSSVYATSPSDVWIFGSIWRSGADEALFFNGVTWQTTQLPITSGGTNEVAVLGPASVWAISAGTCLSHCPTVATYWHGHGWLPSKIPLDVWGITAAGNHVYAIAVSALRPADQTFVPMLYERLRGRWVRRAVVNHRLSNPLLAASSVSDVWIWGHLPGPHAPGVLYHWNGARLQQVAVPASLVTTDVLTADGHGGVWAGPFAHWTGEKWISFRADAQRLEGMLTALAPIPGTKTTWLVGGLVSHGQDQSFAAVNSAAPPRTAQRGHERQRSVASQR